MKATKALARRTCCCLVFFCLAGPVWAQVKDAPEIAQSPRAFVEGFYRWYVPLAQGTHEEDPLEFALMHKAPAFSPELWRLLKEDTDAQAKCHDIIGLDMDPFLTSRDEDNYEVGKVAQVGGNYQAEIYGVWQGKRLATPISIAEFSEAAGHWFFVNFHYPKGGDLLTALKKPRPACSMPVQ